MLTVLVFSVAAFAQYPVYDGFSDAESEAVSNSPAWKDYYRQAYYANMPNFAPITMTGFVTASADADKASYLNPVGVVDELSLSPLLTGLPLFQEKAASLGVQPGLSGDAASGERTKALNSFRTRGVLIPLSPDDVIGMAQECALVFPQWNLTGGGVSPSNISEHPVFHSLYTTLTKKLNSGPNRAHSNDDSDPLAAILSNVRAFNNQNTQGRASFNFENALGMPLSLVVEEASLAELATRNSATGAETILSYLRTPSNAHAVGLHCLLQQIAFSEPPLFSAGPDGMIAQAISSIAIADGSFTSLLSLNNTNVTSIKDSRYVIAQKVVQEVSQMDALGFHPQVSSVTYFKTRSPLEGLTAGPACSSLFCQLFTEQPEFSPYSQGASHNYNELQQRSIFNMRETYGHQDYGTATYSKTTASNRPAFVQESKASMYMSSNAPVQNSDNFAESVGVADVQSGNGGPVNDVEDRQHATPMASTHPFAAEEGFPSSPNCLEAASPTCSPQGGLNIWAATYLPQSDNDSQSAMLEGSIAVLVPITAAGAVHDTGIPSSSSVAPDLATVLSAIDALSKSFLPQVLQNASSAAGSAILGQLYFFFLVGEEYGFMGSGRLIKEMESFECLSGNGRQARSNATTTNQTASSLVDCTFPFYQFTNFTTLNLDRFDHFISLENVVDGLDVDAGSADQTHLFAYTDTRLAGTSSKQVLVDEILSKVAAAGASSNNTQFNLTQVNFNRLMTSSSAAARDDVLFANASFSLLKATNLSIPAEGGNCSSLVSSISANLTLRTSIPPCSLWPIMASATLASVSTEEITRQVIANRANTVIEDGVQYIALEPPTRWRSKSFTLLTSKKPQLYISLASFGGGGTASSSGLDPMFPFVSGALDTPTNLLYGSLVPGVDGANVATAQARFDRLISIAHATSEVLTTLLVHLVAAANAPNTTTSISTLEKVSWNEVGRLWYCFGANVYCDSFSESLVSPNYYAGVFSYTWSIPTVQSYVASYLSLRLTPPIALNSTFISCVSDSDCVNYYQSCQPTYTATANEVVNSCQFQRVQNTYSFSMAAGYDPVQPAVARFIFDVDWVSKAPFGKGVNGTCGWQNTLQAFDGSNGATSRHHRGGQLRHRIGVESYWGGDSIGVRAAAYLPPTAHYLTLMGGILVLAISLLGGLVAVRLDWIAQKLRTPSSVELVT